VAAKENKPKSTEFLGASGKNEHKSLNIAIGGQDRCIYI
jgi:hypothetical protein